MMTELERKWIEGERDFRVPPMDWEDWKKPEPWDPKEPWRDDHKSEPWKKPEPWDHKPPCKPEPPYHPVPPFPPMPKPGPRPEPCFPEIDGEAKILKKLSAVQSDLFLIRNYLKDLKLSDLVDVTACLNPSAEDILAYNGQTSKWENTKLEPISPNPTIDIVPEVLEGDPVASIKIGNEVTRLFSKAAEKVLVQRHVDTGIKIATLKVGDRTYDLYSPYPETQTHKLLVQCGDQAPIVVEAFGGQVVASVFLPEGEEWNDITDGVGKLDFDCSSETATVHMDKTSDRLTFTVDNLSEDISIDVINPYKV